MFLNRNKKNNVYPCKPQFYYIKVEFKGSKLYRHVFVMQNLQEDPAGTWPLYNVSWNHSSLQTISYTFAKSADPDETVCLMGQLVKCNLVCICAVWHSVIELWQKPLFATTDVTKIGAGRVQFQKSGVKGLTTFMRRHVPAEDIIAQFFS